MVVAAPIDGRMFTEPIPDGPMLDRLIGEVMGTPDRDFSLRTRFVARGMYTFPAALCLAGLFALVRR